jgi:hypothetical protein
MSRIEKKIKKSILDTLPPHRLANLRAKIEHYLSNGVYNKHDMIWVAEMNKSIPLEMLKAMLLMIIKHEEKQHTIPKGQLTDVPNGVGTTSGIPSE